MEFKNDLIEIRLMTPQDIPFGMQLKAKAQWNQLEADWALLMRESRNGNFVALYKGTAAGTATTLTYQNRFSWIGMVLVDPAFRGLGIGMALLKKAIEYAKSKGTVRLDATPKGKVLYKTLGFQTERELLRMERQISEPVGPPFPTCKPISSPMLPEITRLDMPVFGAYRHLVLHHLFDHAPQYGYYKEKKGKISGYCLGRSGSNFEQIGPIIAENQADASALLHTALASCTDKPVILDVFTENTPWLNILVSLGFKVQRPLTRMYLGALTYPGYPDLQYAIAGPELG